METTSLVAQFILATIPYGLIIQLSVAKKPNFASTLPAEI